MSATPTLLVGTTKGVFLLDADPPDGDWSIRGPFCDGWPVNHVIGDPATGEIWAAGGGAFPGAGVWRSRDGGESWTLSKLANGQFDAWLEADPAMAAHLGVAPSGPAPFTGEIDALWSLARGPGALYAGAKPAALFASADGGESWRRVESLSEHPSAAGWEPGGAGLTLHTIVVSPEDPAKIWLGISAAGVFATEDGGASWERRNRRTNAAQPGAADAGPGPGRDPHEVELCVHNLVRAPGGAGDMLYQQNHQGVFRSDDGGRSWREITQGLPSSFGFPVAVHPHDPETVWVLPLNGDSQGRFPPDAAAAVWTSDDGGGSWRAQRAGLPQRNCYFTVLRQAMATDRADPPGVYFGTNSGSIFASRDAGGSWTEIARHLPTVLCVETLGRP